ncbi:hypothetical protein [Streptococcus marmotae]|uniref:hypothetical protein n=1 Tax=Streptococcus marmotae TaxID=1825069 RepID=UPI0008296FFC|nr:hypothetical protein [Streptococcus marmotae]
MGRYSYLEVKYHYSPRSGKIERCFASTNNKCPYRTGAHGASKEAVQPFADWEIAVTSRLPQYQQDYFIKDQAFAKGPVISLSSDYNPPYKVTLETMEYLGLTDNEISFFKTYDEIVIVPRTKEGAQSEFQEKNHCDRIFEDLRRQWEIGKLGDRDLRESAPYERWDLMPYIEHSIKTHSLQFDKVVKRPGPDEEPYSMAKVWEDWIKYKDKKGELIELERNNNQYYVYGAYSAENMEKQLYPERFKDEKKYNE